MPPEKGCLFSQNIEKHRKTSQNIAKKSASQTAQRRILEENQNQVKPNF